MAKLTGDFVQYLLPGMRTIRVTGIHEVQRPEPGVEPELEESMSHFCPTCGQPLDDE